MKRLGCFLLLWVLLLAATPVFANDLTLYGGFQRQGELTLRTALDEATETLDPRNFGVFGMRYSTGLVLGSEHTLAYSPNFIESDASAVIYNSNLLVQAPLPIFRPYATAGLGAFFTFGDPPADIGTRFAINYGGGLKLLAAGPLGLRFDVRGYTVPRVQSQTLNIIEVSIGALFSF